MDEKKLKSGDFVITKVKIDNNLKIIVKKPYQITRFKNNDIFFALKNDAGQTNSFRIDDNRFEIIELDNHIEKINKEVIINDANINFPSEEEIIKTIINCVDIRGIKLDYHEIEFGEERSGLISALHKLYNSKNK